MKPSFCRSLAPICRAIAVLASVALAPLSSLSAHASTEAEVTHDFLGKQIRVHGYYAPQQGERKSGLAAEIEARQNGVSRLSDHLAKACAKEDGRILEDWKAALRSQGSEIYSNGVLRIILTANLKDVYKPFVAGKSKVPKTAEGTPLVFRFPAVPQAAVTCGTVKIEFQGKKLTVAPVAMGAAAEAKVVKLLLGSGGVLRVSSPEDNALLESARFGEDGGGESGVVILPIVGG